MRYLRGKEPIALSSSVEWNKADDHANDPLPIYYAYVCVCVCYSLKEFGCCAKSDSAKCVKLAVIECTNHCDYRR